MDGPNIDESQPMGNLQVVGPSSGDYHPGPIPDLWECFYTLYPRHEAKKDALKAWSRMTQDEQLAAVTAIADWRQVWRAQGREIVHIPLPASWLRGERWTDEVPKGVIGHRPEHNPTRELPVTGDAHPLPRARIPDHVLAMFAKLKEGK